ncbi:HIT family protein [Rhodohalobacter mucosus]|uniref:HIT family protein n=1 Tax=Rhodohalobacter mucosus TaxID=2079485 RepID=A0A316TT94_9BACT|nr:HIT family protein [Rhodohalobacter mucosus]PWN05482.1 HIT family protein [Rhodohalobacter mucosus]
MRSVFTEILHDQWLHRSTLFFIVPDKYPVSPGHLLIISRRDCTNFFDLTKEEQAELPSLILKAKELIEQTHSPDGYNIGMNCGEAAGQTVFHFHCHVIPRYEGDMDDPRGGVRHSVKGKGFY